MVATLSNCLSVGKKKSLGFRRKLEYLARSTGEHGDGGNSTRM